MLAVGTGLFGLADSVWAVWVWDISVTTFLYMNNWSHLFI